MLNRHVMGSIGFVVACAVSSSLVLAERALNSSGVSDPSGRGERRMLASRQFSGPVACCPDACVSIGGRSSDVVRTECQVFACTDGTHAYFARLQMRSALTARSRLTELAVAGTETTVAATPTFNGSWTPSGHLSLFLRHDAIAAPSGTSHRGESSHGEEWLEGDTLCLILGPSASHIRELEEANPGGYW